jgi:pimeloyl-ACP methyl ester carboxylesterase
MQAVCEHAVVFGQFNGLVGIVSERLAECDLPGIVILNTGIVHRVGAGRLTVLLARRLALAGHDVLRFDLSGIGDSTRRGDDLPPAEAAMADLSDALGWFQAARGVQRVILIGNCSGADLALHYAATDARVVGMTIIDASTPPTRWHYVRKCFNHKVWRRKFEAILSVVRARRALPKQVIPADVWQYDDTLPLGHPEVHSDLADGYRNAFAKSVQTLAIFTAGAAWYNYRNQLFDAFPELDFTRYFQFQYLKRCDHLITHEANRSILFEIIETWLADTEFKRPAPEPSSSESNESISLEF